MKLAAHKLLFFVLFALAAVNPRAAFAAAPRDLLAHGTGDYLWAAEVYLSRDPDSPGERTRVQYRKPGDARTWQKLDELAGRAVSLANRGSELLILLDGGEWRFVSDTGSRSGIPLPAGTRILDFAGGDNDTVWAVGAYVPGAASVPSAAPISATSASTSPATQPHPLALFQLVRGAWLERAPLPEFLKREDILGISMAVIDHAPKLAILQPDRAIHIYTFLGGAVWSETVGARDFKDENRFKLLDLNNRAMLWISDGSGPGTILLADEKWSPRALEPPPKLTQFARCDLAVALGQIRLICSDGKERLMEQVYGPDGKPRGDVMEAAAPATPIPTSIWNALEILLAVVLMFVMLGTMRKRDSLQEAAKNADKLALAPLMPRLAAGVIDAAPVIVALFILARGGATAQQMEQRMSRFSPEMMLFAGGLVLYLLHTTVTELLTRRTLGKALFRLHVATLDGGRPRALLILIRNLFRVFDVVLVFPLMLVIFSPLHQRVGDVAGGTIVVLDEPQAQAKEEE